MRSLNENSLLSKVKCIVSQPLTIVLKFKIKKQQFVSVCFAPVERQKNRIKGENKSEKAVIYARYSSNNQTEQSIEGQVHVCQDFAKRNDIVIVDSYIDRAISGTTDEREAFQRMLKDSNNKKWDYVLVYKLDRFARNKYESAIHGKHLKDNGVKLLSAMENIPETPEGVLLERRYESIFQRRISTKSESWLT